MISVKMNVALLALLLVFWVNPSEGNILRQIEKIFRGKFEDSSIEDLLSKTDKNHWHNLMASHLKRMDAEKLEKLLEADRKNVIPDRVKDQIQLILDKKLSKDEKIKDLGGYGIKNSEILEIMSTLPGPDRWTENDVAKMEKFILKLDPVKLKMISNDEAQEKLQEIMKDCKGSSRRHCNQKHIKIMETFYMKKKEGNPEDWKDSKVEDMEIEDLMQPRILRSIRPEVLATRTEDIVKALNTDEGEELLENKKLARIVVKKLARANKVMKMTKESDVRDFVNSLDELDGFLLPSDIPEEILKKSNILQSKTGKNVKHMLEKGQLPPRDVRKIRRSMSKIKGLTEEEMKIVGKERLCLAAPEDFDEFLKGSDFLSNTDIEDITIGCKSIKGPEFRSKMKSIAKYLAKSNERSSDPKLSNFDVKVINQMPMRIINKVKDNEAAKLLDLDVDVKIRNILISKVQSTSFTKSHIKAALPISKLGKMKSNSLETFVRDLPSTAPASKKLAYEEFSKEDRIKASDMSKVEDALTRMSKSDAKKFVDEDIMEIFDKMKDRNPPLEASGELKNKLVNFSKNFMGTKGEGDLPQKLTTRDIEILPIAVTAALGPSGIRKLGKLQKDLAFDKLTRVPFPELSINKASRDAIIREGFNAKGKPRGLSVGDMDKLGTVFMDVPPEELRDSNDKEELKTAYEKINDAIMKNKSMPCFSKAMRDALASAIKKVKGSPSTWDDLDGFECLLVTLSRGDLKGISSEIITSRSCDANGQFDNYEKNKMADCMANMPDDYESLKLDMKEMEKIRREAAIKNIEEINTQDSRKNRKRRATDESSSCDLARIGGSNSLTIPELDDLSERDVMDCLDGFGNIDFELKEEVAKKLAELAISSKRDRINTFTAEELEDMGRILQGFTPEQLEDIRTLESGTYDGAVTNMGNHLKWDEDQLKVLGKKVAKDWRQIKSYSPENLLSVKNLICGFSEDDIEDINADTYLKVAPQIGDAISKCEYDPIGMAIGKIVVQAYGATKDWNYAETSEMKGAIATLSPEDFRDVPSECFESVSHETVNDLPRELVKSMKNKQLESLPMTTAKLVSQDIQSNMDAEQKASLREAIKGNVGGYANKNVGGFGLVFVLLIILLLNY